MTKNVKVAVSTTAVVVIVALAALAVLTLAGIWPATDQTAPNEAATRLSADFITHTVGGDRPATLVLSGDHDGTPLPLVIALHAFGSSGWIIEDYNGLTERVRHSHIALLLPNGTVDENDERFWNATDYCCDLFGTGVDDVQYLRSLTEEVAGIVPTTGTYLYGVSNGGFMAYRMACESLPNLVAIAIVGGSTFHDPTRCDGANPVSVLHVHGTLDDTIGYDGLSPDAWGVGFASARGATLEWAERAGCQATPEIVDPPLDLDGSVAGAETTISRFTGCNDNRSIELWTVEGGGHVPAFDYDATFAPRLIDWFLHQPLP